MKKVLVFVAALTAAVCSVNAQVDFAYEAGTDIVSSYIWRGQYNGGLSLQPEGLVGFDALDEAIQFRAGVWANIGASDWQFKPDKGDGRGYTMFMPEVDFIASFAFYGASVGFNEYYYCDDGSTHTSEIWFGYNFDHFFDVGLYINWYTTVAGNDFVLDRFDNERRAWSSYLELGYDYTWEEQGITLGGQIGMSPWASDLYGNEKFAVTNISLKLNKEFEFDALTLDLYAQGTINPDGITTQNAFIGAAGEDKLYNQKLNAVLGIGIWF
ncbi:MAG: hypothetical protein J5884_04100 [Paludibacteraceae bacterium]|nr:hypothetical protein [Paludibacteraceae bacterium]